MSIDCAIRLGSRNFCAKLTSYLTHRLGIVGLPIEPEQRDGHLLGRVLRAVQGGLSQAEQGGRREQAQVREPLPGANFIKLFVFVLSAPAK